MRMVQCCLRSIGLAAGPSPRLPPRIVTDILGTVNPPIHRKAAPECGGEWPRLWALKMLSNWGGIGWSGRPRAPAAGARLPYAVFGL